MIADCECCGYTSVPAKLTEVEWQDDPMLLCAVCAGGGLAQVAQELPPSHRSLPRALATIANAMIDAHGASYRDQVEAALAGEALPGGSYESW